MGMATSTLKRIGADVSQGWNSSVRNILTGALAAVPFSGLAAIMLHWLSPLGDAVIVLIVGILQLFLGYALAGELTRRERSN